VKIGILWTELSGYMNACLRELASRDSVELFVAHLAPGSDAPFDESLFRWIENRLMWRSRSDLASLDERLRDFAPDALVFAGWAVPAYRKAARSATGKRFRIMAMDNCWHATPKQRLATWVSWCFLRPMADAVWLPGERQVDFAKKMGFGQHPILRGLYSCDQPYFETVHKLRVSEGRPVPRSFIFVGRFVSDKGIATLAKAYELYRETSPDPWPLFCCGAGPLASLLENWPGVHIEGFLQPERLRAKFGTAGCLVLPSDFEPWAVVVHEATSAGLLVLASENVGASVHLVQDNYNGHIFGRADVKGLASLMTRVSALSDARLDAMSQASHLLSTQFSPRRWADTLLEAARHAVPPGTALPSCSDSVEVQKRLVL
jgi:glycosyltransferase involved in cell wall biosynthesis